MRERKERAEAVSWVRGAFGGQLKDGLTCLSAIKVA